jgi:hypothetical protein
MIVRMTRTFLELSRLTNRALLARVDELVRRERRVQAALIANLSELDARRLYLDEGCSSFYAYCVERLGYSESAAYRRMEAARAVRRFPVVLERLGSGALNLTTVALLAKHLTAANHRELLDAAVGKSKVEVEALIARVTGVFAAPRRRYRRRGVGRRRGQRLRASATSQNPLPLAEVIRPGRRQRAVRGVAGRRVVRRGRGRRATRLAARRTLSSPTATPSPSPPRSRPISNARGNCCVQ